MVDGIYNFIPFLCSRDYIKFYSECLEASEEIDQTTGTGKDLVMVILTARWRINSFLFRMTERMVGGRKLGLDLEILLQPSDKDVSMVMYV